MTKSKLQAKLGTLRRKIGNSQPGHKPERHEPTDEGNALLWVLLAMAITAILLVTAGPSLLDLLRGARESSLQTGFSGAVQSVQSRIQAEPEWMGSKGFTGEGIPTAEFMDTLTRDGGDYTWHSAWELPSPGAAEANNIYVQFLSVSASATPTYPDVAISPKVPWLIRNGTALRIQAANEDNTWICALLVFRPTLNGTNATPKTKPRFLTSTGAQIGTTVDVPRDARIEASLSGTWYDTGDSYTDQETYKHCSPVGESSSTTTSAPFVYLPFDTNNWYIKDTLANTNPADDVINHLTRKP